MIATSFYASILDAEQRTPGQQLAPGAQLQRSLNKWETLKAKCSGNYSYTIRWSSFAGFGHETTIVVKDNAVAERRYREFSGRSQVLQPGKPPKPEGETWTERGKEIGTHKKGAAAKTLDELTRKRSKLWRPSFSRTSGCTFDSTSKDCSSFASMSIHASLTTHHRLVLVFRASSWSCQRTERRAKSRTSLITRKDC